MLICNFDIIVNLFLDSKYWRASKRGPSDATANSHVNAVADAVADTDVVETQPIMQKQDAAQSNTRASAPTPETALAMQHNDWILLSPTHAESPTLDDSYEFL
jgi:hypothetical protein